MNDISEIRAAVGRLGGLKTSKAKRRSSKLNGQLGGRPRKTVNSTDNEGKPLQSAQPYVA
jgi:hypothetical protein